ncbi:testis-expressed protein 48 isoform X3 [Tamandua tetradactyla]|uniref:testis-expressed protein 48 isoform X3 n=1 Tax=Tamandua tetradactyla TaxID=48850 RepID=UPI0040539656
MALRTEGKTPAVRVSRPLPTLLPAFEVPPPQPSLVLQLCDITDTLHSALPAAGNSPAQRTVLNPKISEFNKAPLQPIQTWPQRSSVVAARTARGPPPLFAPTVRGGPNRFIGRSPSI